MGMKTPLTKQQIVAFMTLKNIKPECSECGHGSVGYEDETTADTRFSLLKFPFPHSNIAESGATDVVFLNCNNCGYVRLFKREIVLASLSSK